MPITPKTGSLFHADSHLCPLASEYLLYLPAAFDEKSRALIELLVPKGKRIAVEEADALELCCNAVDLEGYVFMNDASENLQNRLRSAGFTPVITPLSEFMKAGGAAKCLTLKLIETSALEARSRPQARRR
jgi:N-dimethylarginine dimethylaminohydrolase